MMTKTIIIVLAILFVVVPHVVLIVLAVRSNRQRKAPVKLLPMSQEERLMFGARHQ